MVFLKCLLFCLNLLHKFGRENIFDSNLCTVPLAKFSAHFHPEYCAQIGILLCTAVLAQRQAMKRDTIMEAKKLNINYHSAYALT